MSKGTPQPIADVLAQLLARRGYARQVGRRQLRSGLAGSGRASAGAK